ncbi:MAG: sterol desaturase family protein [Polyangiales bacterium]
MDLYTVECREAAQGRVARRADGTKPQSIRVFKSPVLELLGVAHPITPALWWVPMVIYGGWVGAGHFGAARMSALFGFGVLIWTLLEYVLHRFVFHMSANDEAGRFRRFMLHWYHHEFPNDRMRLLAPPMMSWTMAPVVWLSYHAVLGAHAVWPVFAGTVLGYLVYDYVHYYTHHARPRYALGKWLRNYHLRHHHEKRESRFGVSTPLWDLVFGTYEPIRRGAEVRQEQPAE